MKTNLIKKLAAAALAASLVLGLAACAGVDAATLPKAEVITAEDVDDEDDLLEEEKERAEDAAEEAAELAKKAAKTVKKTEKKTAEEKKKEEKKAEEKKAAEQSAAAPAESTPSAPSAITLDDAIYIALADAGVGSVTWEQTVQDYENGILVYEIDFTAGGYEYDYDIDAYTGAILDRDIEPVEAIYDYDDGADDTDDDFDDDADDADDDDMDDDDDYDDDDDDAPAPADVQTITADQALSVALSHAGLSGSQVTLTKNALDTDDGITVYEIEFRSGDYEFEYDIDACSGAILDWDKEIDD